MKSGTTNFIIGDRVKQSLTEKQKEFINAHCSCHYKGVVRPGYTGKPYLL